MSPIFLGLSDYLYREYMTDTLQGYFKWETDKCLMHLQIWPWNCQPSYLIVNLFDIDGLINQYTIWCLSAKNTQ